MTKPWRLPIRYLILGALLVGLATLTVMPMLAKATESKAATDRGNKALAQVTISLTDKGIVAVPTALRGGNYLLTIKNKTSEPRGIEMIGVDRAGSPTVRYTKTLKPDNSEQFRWYFAAGTTAFVRDVVNWTHTKTGFTNVTFGKMRKAILVK